MRFKIVLVLLALLFLSAVPALAQAQINFERALGIALALYPDATLVEGELTRWDNGAAAWDMKLSNGLAVYVDATTGAILEVEPWSRERGRSGDVRRGTGWFQIGPPPWAGFPGGRRAWEAQQGDTSQGRSSRGQSASEGISLQRAADIALGQYPNARLVEAELTRWERRVPAWEIKLSNGMEIYIDAVTGVILEIEIDD